MTATAIKPCPFCRNADPAIDEIDAGLSVVVCNCCHAIGPHRYKQQSASDAIRQWDDRPDEGCRP